MVAKVSRLRPLLTPTRGSSSHQHHLQLYGQMEQISRRYLPKPGGFLFMPYKDPEKQKEAQRKWEKENRGTGKRHKVWMFIFYPDTAEVGWRDECDELGLPFLVSPLHDRDVWTAADERRNPDHIEGEVKVAHYHGLVEYPQPVDYDTVKEDFAFLHTHSIKYAKSKASMALYLTHEKCSDKVQYDWRTFSSSAVRTGTTGATSLRTCTR